MFSILSSFTYAFNPNCTNSGAIVYWNHNEPSGVPLLDYCGNNNVTNIGTPTSVIALYENGTDFDDPVDFYQINDSDHTGLNLGNNNFTLITFINVDTSNDNIAMDKTDFDGSQTSYALTGSQSRATCRLDDDGTGFDLQLQQGMNANVWNLVACVYNGTDFAVWLNSELVVVAPYTTGAFNNTGVAFRIGNDGNGRGMDGTLDDSAIFNFPLSEANMTFINRSLAEGGGIQAFIDTFAPPIDTTPPVLTWTNPDNDNSTLFMGNLLWSVLATDTNLDDVFWNITQGSILIYENESLNIGLTTFNIVDTTILINNLSGVYNASVRACDSSSNCVTENSFFTLDNTPPNITHNTANNSNFLEDIIFNLDYTPNDLFNISQCNLFTNITGSFVITANDTTITNDVINSFPISVAIGNRTYLYGISCNDTLGNLGFSSNQSFIINLPPPPPLDEPFNTVRDNILILYLFWAIWLFLVAMGFRYSQRDLLFFAGILGVLLSIASIRILTVHILLRLFWIAIAFVNALLIAISLRENSDKKNTI